MQDFYLQMQKRYKVFSSNIVEDDKTILYANIQEMWIVFSLTDWQIYHQTNGTRVLTMTEPEYLRPLNAMDILTFFQIMPLGL